MRIIRKPMYVSREILNGADIVSWAKAQGFPKIVDAKLMHVTIAYSRTAVDFNDVVARINKITVNGGEREVKLLGEDAVVLKFSSKVLAKRWNELCDAGCSWDYDGYQSHISVTYDGSKLNTKDMIPYDGPIILGPEKVEELDLGYADKVKEN
jgi:hypothetical protein